MITLEDYLMGRDREYPEEYAASNVHDNAQYLLLLINKLLKELGIENAEVRSGWRPREINVREGGSLNSYHIVGKTLDISDSLGGIYSVLEEADKDGKLEAYGLWMEHKDHTPSWVHLDTGNRRKRKSRIFYP